AYAFPGPGGNPCIPDATTTGNDADLVGTLRLVDGALVGLDSRISLDGAKLQVPNPKCEGQFIQVPSFTHVWSITGRPAGSVASMTHTFWIASYCYTDCLGDWQV